MSEGVEYSSCDPVAAITLDRPESPNAVSREVALGLETAVDQRSRWPRIS